MHKAYGSLTFGVTNKTLAVTTLIMAMLCFGCSGLGRMTSLRMDDQMASSAAANSGAKMSQIKTKRFTVPGNTAAYKFEISHSSIVFCPGNIRSTGISVGPPLLPIIPSFLFCIGEVETKSDTDRKRIEDLHHSIVIAVDGREEQVELDFSLLSLKLMNGTPVTVNTIRALGSDEACTDNRYRLSFGSENLLASHVIIKNSKEVYWVVFDASTGDVDGLLIDLGPIKIEGKTILFPPVEYRKQNNYYYVPFYLPLPS